jgi:YggT family protein
VGIGVLIARLLQLYGYLIIAYVVMSWIVAGSGSGLVQDLYRVLASVCEPYVGLFRRIVPPISVGAGGLDLSPFIALIVLQIIGGIVARIG